MYHEQYWEYGSSPVDSPAVVFVLVMSGVRSGHRHSSIDIIAMMGGMNVLLPPCIIGNLTDKHYMFRKDRTRKYFRLEFFRLTTFVRDSFAIY